MTSTSATIQLCHLNDIPDGGSKEFYPNGEPLFAVRSGDQIHVYRNSCPHTGMPLNWQPDQFFDLDRKYIQCAIHAAIFQPDTGLCVAGPCSGEYLDSVESEVRNGMVFIDQPEPLDQ
ncbi:Rieske (2Fe-2S) protein [Porticoccaceae bacterium LTM1]|nr:Rieske (2Fe-2S) protein [Porticoccaceae bacterium LTM1]